MIKIDVTAKQIKEISDCLDGYVADMGPYAAACEYGFPGFCGGEDHIEVSPWSIILVDRGLSGCGRTRDNTTKFVVPMKDRKGPPPLHP